MTRRFCCLVLSVFLLAVSSAFAGGPLVVGGPSFGVEGQPFTWETASFPIQYRVDGGPMSTNSTGKVIIDNPTGLARVQKMFGNWQSVPTTNISYSYAGPIQAAGSFTGGDVQSVTQFNDVIGSCRSGAQSPIIFDAAGIIVSAMGLDSDIIGFAGQCKLDTSSGHIVTAFALLNGQFQDGISSPTNPELTSDQFDQAIIHEFGHFSGLDHSQINVSVMYGPAGNCTSDDLAGLPIMFPILQCQARATAGLTVLSPDDMAWISKLYPAANYSSTYGTISGLILFSDGISHVQGVNVIARRLDDASTPADESRQFAVSVVSGYRFTGNPGQPVTGDNTNGDKTGSRSPLLIGAYEIPVPAGTYTVEVESINSGFTGGSGVGPLDPPARMPGLGPEFWNMEESAFDDYSARDPIIVAPGQNVNGINVILNGTPPRFDQFEDGGSELRYPIGPFRLANLGPAA